MWLVHFLDHIWGTTSPADGEPNQASMAGSPVDDVR